jgi:hypothetical protein
VSGGARSPDTSQDTSSRIARQLASELGQDSLGPSSLGPVDHSARGQLLAERIVAPLVGVGPFRDLTDASLPMGQIVAFGYDTAGMIHDCLDRPVLHRRDVSELGAIFNLGIVLVDRACDGGAAGPLAEALLPSELPRWFSGSPTAVTIGTRPQVKAVHLALVVVAAFFARLRQVGIVDAAALRPLVRLMQSTYEAELRSAGVVPGEDRAHLAALTSRGPFDILLALACACESVKTPPVRAARLVERMAATFGVIDDVVDFARDLRNRDLNAIAATYGERIDDDVVLALVADLAASVRATVKLLMEAGSPAAALRARALFLGYVWSWLGPPSEQRRRSVSGRRLAQSS